MNPEVKTKWVEALRSGKYSQGKRLLNRGNREFCCLGVLCELAVENGVVEKDSDGASAIAYGRFNDKYGLPGVVQKWAGIDNDAGNLPEEVGVHLSLAGLNDNGSTFDEIAETIERYL